MHWFILINAILLIYLRVKNIFVWLVLIYAVPLSALLYFLPPDANWYSHPFFIIWLVCYFMTLYSQSSPRKPR